MELTAKRKAALLAYCRIDALEPGEVELGGRKREDTVLRPLRAKLHPRSVVVDGEIPGGWTYITNNPEYPNPEFYSSDGGLKLNYANQAILSPIFENDYTTIGLEGKINKNTRTGTTPSTLTVYTVEGETEVEVGSISFPPESASTFTTSFTLEAGSAQFLIKLTSNVGYNINLKTITFA